MCKILEIMKALRYLLIVVAILSVMGVSAQTPQYGKSYNPQHRSVFVTNTQGDSQLPAATMGSMDAEYMHSGSNLPMAAESGVTTTLDEQNPERRNLSRPRKERPGDWEHPYDDPLGDVMWPMMMLALAYLIMRVVRRHTRALSRSLRDVK